MDAALGVLAGGGTVVTANNRLARAIELAFNRRQSASGKLAWQTPAVMPWLGWMEQLWWASFSAGGEAGRLRLLSDIQSRSLWREILRESGNAALSDGDGSAATLAMGAWLLCQDWGIDPQTLSREADSDDSRIFAAWAGRYQGRCAAEGWADVRMSVAHLMADVLGDRIRPAGHVALAGFDELPALHRGLLDALSASGITVEILPMDQHGSGQARRVRCANQQQELEMAARWARWHREDDPAAAIAVVVPDLATRATQVRREFLDVFAPDWRLQPGREQPVNFSWGASLAHAGIARTALLLLRGLTGQLDYREAGELLKTAYLPGCPGELGQRARLELGLRRQIGTTADLSRLAERAREPAPEFSARLRALPGSIGDGPALRRLGEWTDVFGTALKAAGWPGDRALASDEFQAAAAVQNLLAGLRSCELVTGPVTLERAVALLERLARDQVFQPAGNPQVVQVLGLMEALGQRFDKLWICGLTSDAWPPPARPNPLLPLALQKRLGMPDSSAALCRERAQRRLVCLLGGAASAVTSWADMRGEQEQRPSPLTSDIPPAGPGDVPQWPGLRLAEGMIRSGGTEPVRQDPVPPVREPCRFQGGIALLERQARCPARAFLEFRLGARELDTPSPGLDAGRRGSILHGVLELFFQRISSHGTLCSLPVDEQQRLLDSLIDGVMDARLPMGDPLVRAMARLEKARLQGILAGFLDQERARPPFRVLWTEDMVSSMPLPPAVAALGLSLRPDRVDELDGGRKLVIDYKTGRKLPGRKELYGPRPRSPQLPLYALAADADGIGFAQLTIAGSQWLGVGDEAWQIQGITDPGKWTDQAISDWTGLRGDWRASLERMAREFLDGSFTVDRWKPDEAAGQWAMAIRTWEIPGHGEEGEESAEEAGS